MGTGTQWCPMTNSPCRDDCAWADTVVTITEDGVEREVFCCVTMMAAVAVRAVGSAEECEHGFGS